MNINNSISFIISIITFLSLTFTALIKKNKLILLKELLSDKGFIINVLFITLFCFYVIYYSSEKNKERRTMEIDAIKKAILAMIIATFAYLDMIIASFWVVFIVAFYLKGYV